MAKHQPPTSNEAEGHRRHFDPTFKHEAVALGKRIGIPQAAKDLGINETNLRNWTQAVADRGSQAFAPMSQRTDGYGSAAAQATAWTDIPFGPRLPVHQPGVP